MKIFSRDVRTDDRYVTINIINMRYVRYIIIIIER